MKHPPGSLLFIGNLGAPGWIFELISSPASSTAVHELLEGDPVIVIRQSVVRNGEALCFSAYGLVFVHIEDLELCSPTKL